MWLKLKEGETIHAVIDFNSVKSIAKHWTGQRSELCLGQGCPHCLTGNPKRWRYQAKLIVDGAAADWEFGEESMTALHAIPHEANWAHISITRQGEGKATRYQISAQQESQERQAPLPIANKYTEGKYGQFVKS